jgi:hypothetical protein
MRFAGGARLASSVASLSALILVLAAGAPAHADSIGNWNSTTAYPLQVSNESCVTNSGYAYCVGGMAVNYTDSKNVYYAQMSSSGMGTWSPTTSYLQPVDSTQCVAASGYVYCIGGTNSTALLTASYYAKFSSPGIGAWSATTAYPILAVGASCVASGGYVYCIGGFDGNVDTGDVYYAPLSSSGIGQWSLTTSYPQAVDDVSCQVISGYIYCVAGENDAGPINNVYYAQLSGSGIGAWNTGTAYPAQFGAAACTTTGSGYLDCVGGFDSSGASNNNVYLASTSTQGVGNWSPGSNYPIPIDSTQCVSSSGYVYCIAGSSYSAQSQADTTAVYYAPITSGTVSTTTTTASTTSTTSTTTSTSSTAQASTTTVTVTSVSTSTSVVTSTATANGPGGATSTTTVTATLIQPGGGTTVTSTSVVTTTSSATTTVTLNSTPEFPISAAIPLTLLACLLLVAAASSYRRSRQGEGRPADPAGLT